MTKKKQPKRPKDTNQLAKTIVEIATEGKQSKQPKKSATDSKGAE